MKERSGYLSQRKNFICAFVLLWGGGGPILAEGFPFPVGARSWGMANATVARADMMAGFHNIAGLGALEEAGIFTAYDAYYGLEGIGTMALGAVMPLTEDLGLGLSIQRFGDKFYNESALGLGAGHRIGRFRLGLQVRYLQNAVNTPSLSFSNHALALELGGLVELSSRFMFGAHVFNLTQSKYSGEYGRRLPTILRAGFVYQPQEGLVLNVELEKNTNLPVSIKTGLEYRVWKLLYLRTGLSSHPLSSHFGLGIKASKFNFDYAVHSHPHLGWSHHLSLAYAFGQSKK